jgi:hypothetical protein
MLTAMGYNARNDEIRDNGMKRAWADERHRPSLQRC